MMFSKPYREFIADVTMPLASLYHGTKWAVEGLSESLTYELEPLGIKVKVIEPGAIKTDFGTRSLDFNNDESLAAYQPGIATYQEAIGALTGDAIGPERVAETIYEAALDESDRLRYLVGDDSEQWYAARQATDDMGFRAAMREQIGF